MSRRGYFKTGVYMYMVGFLSFFVYVCVCVCLLVLKIGKQIEALQHFQTETGSHHFRERDTKR